MSSMPVQVQWDAGASAAPSPTFSQLRSLVLRWPNAFSHFLLQRIVPQRPLHMTWQWPDSSETSRLGDTHWDWKAISSLRGVPSSHEQTRIEWTLSMTKLSRSCDYSRDFVRWLTSGIDFDWFIHLPNLRFKRKVVLLGAPGWIMMRWQEFCFVNTSLTQK